MPTWTVLQHVAFEHPGLIAEIAAEREVELDVRRMDLGAEIPTVSEIDGLVAMGGPMGALDDPDHPNLAAERELLATAARAGLPVLGVCLGAQLLVAGLGGMVTRGPAFELGFGSIEILTDDPVLGAIGSAAPVLHWHQDTFSVPSDAVLLARSAEYPHQAFRLGPRAYGLQFHVEVDRSLAAELAPHLPEAVALPEADRTRVEAYGREALGRFFDLAR
jgi:GMP synthase-like glutamine amidotransferase